ncbi:MAG: hypothetical protein Q4D57_02295 [Clostridia bacterium]|nr:hypothetical protein [Clostridia bacterium]
MKLKFEAQIITGRLKIYEENDMSTPAYTVNVETEDNEHFRMKISGKHGRPVGEVLYKENLNNKFLMVNNYVIHDFEGNAQIRARAEISKKIFFGENKDMYLTRSIRDRKMMFYDGDKLIMNLKCKTLIRNWLRGDYTAEILDESYTSLCICVIAVALNVIFDENNCTSFNP